MSNYDYGRLLENTEAKYEVPAADEQKEPGMSIAEYQHQIMNFVQKQEVFEKELDPPERPHWNAINLTKPQGGGGGPPQGYQAPAAGPQVVKEKDKPFCPECGESYASLPNLQRHIASVHSIEEVICDDCGKTFKSRRAFRDHRAQVHTIVDDCICHICAIKCKNKIRLKAHIRNCLASKKQAPKSYVMGNVGDQPELYCAECNKTFASKKYMRDHRMYTHSTGQQTCTLCHKTVKNMFMLKQHLKRIHNISDKKEVREIIQDDGEKNSVHKTYIQGRCDDYPFLYCQECDKTFFTDVALRAHNAYSHKSDPVVCSICQKVVKNQATLYQHYRNKHKLRNKDDIRHVEMGGDVSSLDLPQQSEVGFGKNSSSINSSGMFALNSYNEHPDAPLEGSSPGFPPLSPNSSKQSTPLRVGPYIPYVPIPYVPQTNLMRDIPKDDDEATNYDPQRIPMAPNERKPEMKEERSKIDTELKDEEGDDGVKIECDVKLEAGDSSDDEMGAMDYENNLDGNDHDDDSSDWEEESPKKRKAFEKQNPVACPICCEQLEGMTKLKKHLRDDHNFKDEAFNYSNVQDSTSGNVEVSSSNNVSELDTSGNLSDSEKSEVTVKKEVNEDASKDLQNNTARPETVFMLTCPLPMCRTTLKNKAMLRQHLKKTHLIPDREERAALVSSAKEEPVDEEAVICPICSKPYKSFQTIWEHLRRKHKLDKEAAQKLVPDVKQRCDQCDKEFPSYTLRLHVTNFHTFGDFTCEHCGEKFELKGKLHNHWQKYHKAKPDPSIQKPYANQYSPVGAPMLPCDQCGTLVRGEKGLALHLARFHKIGEYPCKKCGEVFEIQARLKCHMDKHKRKELGPYYGASGEFSCTDCGETFEFKKKLMSHIYYQHDVKGEYICPDCGKVFEYKKKLLSHKSYHHDGAKQRQKAYKQSKGHFLCNHCGQEFNKTCLSNKQFRIRHQIGTDAKPIEANVEGIEYQQFRSQPQPHLERERELRQERERESHLERERENHLQREREHHLMNMDIKPSLGDFQH